MTWIIEILCGPLGLILFPIGFCVAGFGIVALMVAVMEMLNRLLCEWRIERVVSIVCGVVSVVFVVGLILLLGYAARRDFCRWQHHAAYIQGAC